MNETIQDNAIRQDEDMADIPFEIPELPSGSRMELRLLSNWGDNTHIGLNGIEVFSFTGKRAEIVEVSSPSQNFVGDPNSLVVENYFFTDRHNLWKAELNGNDPVIVTFLLRDATQIAMIRIWNYSESRVRAQIGVHHLEIRLDDVLIFRGEMNPSYKNNEEIEPMGDTVLFTTDEAILERIAENDVCLLTTPFDINAEKELSGIDTDPDTTVQLTPYRPSTAEITPITNLSLNDKPVVKHRVFEQPVMKVKVLHLEILANWGHPDFVGLTGIEIIGPKGKTIKFDEICISESTGTDVGVLLNGRNLTRSPSDMWLLPCDNVQKVIPTIIVRFTDYVEIRGVSVWNYNASSELSYAGVRAMNVYTNGKLTSSNVLLRKAPGFVYFDFVQDVLLDPNQLFVPSPIRPATYSISGFIFQVRLLSTWGDEFYIGLNGIELFNTKGERIRLKTHNMAAFPESVNILPSVEKDPRTSDNLINGDNDTENPCNMWLTPLLPNRCARVFFIFDAPMYVSKMIIYNYRKTPARGVRHLSITVDDLIVYSGEVPQSSEKQTGILSIDLREHN
ncbi:unnamed protein product [Auanema sp. JU1783]|nr:unnamed protein product [Auanema sp. JU1783]